MKQIELIISNQKLIINRIATVDYVMTDETVNHISEYHKMAQKEYKSRPDWVGKVIHWELYKWLKFGSGDKSRSMPKNAIYKIF